MASPDPTLRLARDADVPALLGLEAQFPSDRMTARQFGMQLASRRATLKVAELQGRVVGYHVVRRRWFSRFGWLYSLAVAADLHRQGIGRRLLADAEALARAAGRRGLRLEVRQDNPAAIALYEQAGYRRIGRIRRYYEDGRDAWKYRREWTDP